MTAHHRHQASLEEVLDFSSPPSLTPDELARADHIFNQLLNHCEPLQKNKPYKKVTLVRLMHEHARSKEIFLIRFFLYLATQRCPEDQGSASVSDGLSWFPEFDHTSTNDQKKDAERAIDSFAEHIFDNFFLPCKAVCISNIYNYDSH
jgi:hypothetical protein